MNELTEQERLNFKAMMNDANSNYQDNTEYIRKVKHSMNIRDDIRKYEVFKKKHATLKETDYKLFYEKCTVECNFLFNHYTDIFNRLLKDELNLTVMTQLLTVLKMIEDGKIDQNDGSVLVGKVLKTLYLDSAMKNAENLDKQHSSSVATKNDAKNISWNDYKNKTL